jgi:hypothetical protein
MTIDNALVVCQTPTLAPAALQMRRLVVDAHLTGSRRSGCWI